ncbi:MAG: hypothetical protein AAF456_07640 [Planctomycetota bacterium]
MRKTSIIAVACLLAAFWLRPANADIVEVLSDLGTWDNATQTVAQGMTWANMPDEDNQAAGSLSFSQLSLFQPTVTGDLVSGQVRGAFFFEEGGGIATIVPNVRFNVYEYIDGGVLWQDTVGSLVYSTELSGFEGSWSWDNNIDVDDPFELNGLMYNGASLIGTATFDGSFRLDKTKQYYSQWEFLTRPTSTDFPVYGAAVISHTHGGITHWVDTGTGNIVTGFANLNVVTRQNLSVSTIPEPSSAMAIGFLAVFGSAFSRRR